MSTVDLSLAKPGDICETRNGRSEVFCGPSPAGWKHQEACPFRMESGHTYRRDGGWTTCPGETTEWDIVRVTRNGVQVTPPLACSCETCWDKDYQIMHVCPECGNKRCPKATYHRNACTGSNEVGQKGSSWEHVTPAVPSPAESPASGGGEAFHLQGKHVGWEGVTRDGRKVTVVEFVEWPKANGTTEEACRVRDHQTQWAVRLNGRLLTCKEDADDVVGPWVEPPEPVLTITEVKSTDGYVFGLVQKDPSLKHVSLKLHVYNGIPCSYIQGGALGLANSEQSPFVCRYDEWDAVQTLVAEINQLAAE